MTRAERFYLAAERIHAREMDPKRGSTGNSCCCDALLYVNPRNYPQYKSDRAILAHWFKPNSLNLESMWWEMDKDFGPRILALLFIVEMIKQGDIP